MEPVQKHLIEQSKKLDNTSNVADDFSTVDDDSAVKKQMADNLVNEHSIANVLEEDSTTDGPV